MKNKTRKKRRHITSLVRKDDFGRRLVEVGEFLPMMAKKLADGLARCVQDNKHRRDPYYILYSADWYANGEQLRDTFSPRSKCPPRMLNTICWYVNNVTGEFKEMWVLPKDAPIEFFGETGQFDDTLIKSSEGIPILYGD